MTEPLTAEQQTVHDLAIAACAERGQTLKVSHVVGHGPAGNAYVAVYLVIGDIVGREICPGCGGRHDHSEFLLFLRVADGFVELEWKDSVCLQEESDGIKAMRKFFEGGL